MEIRPRSPTQTIELKREKAKRKSSIKLGVKHTLWVQSQRALKDNIENDYLRALATVFVRQQLTKV